MPASSARTPRRRSRHLPGMAWLVGFLVATLALSLWLAYQAQSAARSQRETAVAALRDYARVAAWQYGRIASEKLDAFRDELFEDVPRRARGTQPAPAAEVWWEVEDALRQADCACPSLREPAFAFRTDFRGRGWDAVPEAAAGEAPPALVEAMSARAAGEAHRWGLIVLEAGAALPEVAVVPYMLTVDSAGPALGYGAVFEAAAFGALFDAWYRDAPLLPPAITDAAPNDSLLSLAVHGPDGSMLFESGTSYTGPLVAADTLPAAEGGLVVSVSIRPDAAARLVIGGLPTSRLPLIIGLLVLTLGVGAAALLQIGRERQLARLRDDFISGVSHELRTPLAQIRMFAELQQDGKLRTAEERTRAVRVINREAQRLTHLVENILRFARLRRAGERPTVVDHVNVETVVGEVLEAFRPVASGRATTVSAEIERELHASVQRDALSQILVNLLDNAVKYGPRGQTIVVRGTRVGPAVRVTVDDEGPGIPPGDRERIWEPYVRLRRELDARTSGTGIGLAVVAELASANAGRAWVERAAGGGARFVVEVPAAGARAASGQRAGREVPV